MNKICFKILLLLIFFQTSCDYEIVPDLTAPDSTSNGFSISEGPYYENCTAIEFTNTINDATSFEWDFGDGFTSTVENPAHTFNDAGTYTVKLKVRADGQQFEQSLEIVVSAPITFAKTDYQDRYYRDIAVTNDGDYIAVGVIKAFSEKNAGAFLQKFTNNGELVWDRTINQNGLSEKTISMALTSDWVYVVGGTGSRISVVKTDLAGNIKWREYLPFVDHNPGPIGPIDTLNDNSLYTANDVTVTVDKGIVIAGTRTNVDSPPDIYIVKLDKNGRQSWDQTIEKSDFEVAYSIIQIEDGSFVIAGEKIRDIQGPLGAQGTGRYVLNLDSLGTTIWEHYEEFQGQDKVFSFSIIADINQDYIIVGESDGIGNGASQREFRSLVTKLNINGDYVWSRNLGTEYQLTSDVVFNTTNAIVEIPSEGFVAIGTRDGMSINKLNYNGDLIWKEPFSDVNGYSIALTPDCGLVVVGKASVSGETSTYFLKTDRGGKVN